MGVGILTCRCNFAIDIVGCTVIFQQTVDSATLKLNAFATTYVLRRSGHNNGIHPESNKYI